jgi:hypothetical protein
LPSIKVIALTLTGCAVGATTVVWTPPQAASASPRAAARPNPTVAPRGALVIDFPRI